MSLGHVWFKQANLQLGDPSNYVSLQLMSRAVSNLVKEKSLNFEVIDMS